jgi:hypothetical protein
MTKSLFFLFIIFSTLTNAQRPLKKKYLGKYEGEIAAYKINTGSEFLEVTSTTISLIIQKKELVFTIGRNEMTVPYNWIKKDKKTIQIEFSRSIDDTKEVLILNKKTKEIVRRGVYPQPNCVLKKIRKN